MSRSADDLKAVRQNQTKSSKNVTRIISEISAIERELRDSSRSSELKFDTLLRNQSDNERRDILNWICNTANPSVHHNNAIRSRQPDTGLWFLESTDFQTWIKTPQLLWLSGIGECTGNLIKAAPFHEI